MKTLRLDYPVTVLCRVFDVSRSGFYAWASGKPSQRAQDDARLKVAIEAVHAQSRQTYANQGAHGDTEGDGDRQATVDDAQCGSALLGAGLMATFASRAVWNIAVAILLLVAPERPRDHVQPDYGRLHQELRRKGMTLMLLWEEHRADYADRQTYGYTQFCENYRRFAKQLKRSMRQVHRAGEKLFIDYAGPSIGLTDGSRAHIFVAALGASSYTFACATPRETMKDWLESTARALVFIGGVPQLIVPDNLKAMIATPTATNRAATTRCSTSRATTAPRSCRPDYDIRKTKPRLNRRCRSLSAGSWHACVTSSSTACTRSIRLWRRCLRTLTNGCSKNCQEAAPAPSPRSTHQPCCRCRCSVTRWPTSRR
jgi:hypothetical protein